jgi:hypothetical protein
MTHAKAEKRQVRRKTFSGLADPVGCTHIATHKKARPPVPQIENASARPGGQNRASQCVTPNPRARVHFPSGHFGLWIFSQKPRVFSPNRIIRALARFLCRGDI